MSDLPVFFIMGAQGAGKGTQAKLLVKKLGLFHWDMGAILREDHDFRLLDGNTVGDITDRGAYLSDDQLIEILQRRLGMIPAGKGIVFDGVPRRLGQAQFLLDHLHGRGYAEAVVVYIDVAREESIRRLTLRAEKEKRIDDTPEAIASRLKLTDELTGPLLAYLKGKARLVTVDGNPPVPQVTKNIWHALGIT